MIRLSLSLSLDRSNTLTGVVHLSRHNMNHMLVYVQKYWQVVLQLRTLLRMYALLKVENTTNSPDNEDNLDDTKNT